MSVDYNACLVVGWMVGAEKQVVYDIYDWMCGEIESPEADRAIGDECPEDWCGVTDYYDPATAMRWIGFPIRLMEWERDENGVPQRKYLSIDEVFAEAKDPGKLRTAELLYEALVGEPPEEPAMLQLFTEVS